MSLCDLCKKNQSTSILGLKKLNTELHAEICDVCFEAIVKRTGRPTYTSSSNSPEGKLAPGELVRIPPSLDLRPGSKDLTRLNSSIEKQCTHPFKSYEDGKIICAGPPKGIKGYDGIAGCGAIIKEPT